jgi:hypothetical protein
MANDVVNPQEHDTQTAELFDQAAKAQRNLEAHQNRMHRMARDRQEWIGKRQYWKMTGAQVHDQLRALAAQGDTFIPGQGLKPSEAITREGELQTKLALVMTEIGAMEDVYRAHRWTRYFPCINTNGHIHSSLRGCPSVRHDTLMAWTPELSGKTVEDAVAELGPTLCSICFPLAPVEWQRDKSDVTREQRAAEKLAKQAAKDAVEAAKAARAAARAAKPKKVTPADRRIQGLNDLHKLYPTEAAVLEAGREAVATEIEKLLALGRSERWQNAITYWAAAMRDETNPLTWAWIQLSVLAGHEV